MAPVSGESSSPTTSRLQHSRMTRKATASTTAIQPLEITTTAVVLSDLMRINTESLSSSTSLRHGMNTHLKETEPGEGYSRKPSLHHHTHHHSIKSSTCLTSGKAKKTRAAIMDFNVSPLNTFEDTPLEEAHLAFALPPPVIKSPSEAMTALQDATKDIKQKKGRPPCPPSREDLTQLFDSSFFSAVLLVQWSNVVGPKTEKVWSSEKMDEHLEKTIGRQILNGEMGRVLHREDVEAKWIVLHRQAIVCTGFLYNDEVVGSLCALVLVVPTRYLRNFSQYFGVLQEHVPNQLVKPLVLLRKAYKRHPGMTWPLALEYFTWRRLVPFVHSIMDLESVSLPTECIKISHTILDHESRQMLDSPFIAQVITSHLQTCGSTVLVGNTLTTMNMVINTLALFLTLEEKSRSSHARKNHKYMPHLYLQGLLIQDMEESNTKLESTVFQSILPTTLVNMNRLVVKQTPLFPAYRQRQAHYIAHVNSKLNEELSLYLSEQSRPILTDAEIGWKNGNVFHRTESIAPSVQTLLDETRKVPARMREAYIQQWRHLLVRKALALIKWVEKEAVIVCCNENSSGEIPIAKDIVTQLMSALDLTSWSDFSIVLTQAEKLKPGMIHFLDTYSKRL